MHERTAHITSKTVKCSLAPLNRPINLTGIYPAGILQCSLAIPICGLKHSSSHFMVDRVILL